MIFRTAARLIWFLFDVAFAFINYTFTAARAPQSTKRLARANWLHRSCIGNLKVYNCQASVTGPVPAAGLLISNHLSYLDILVLSSITPAVFVSKSEVRHWPVCGWLAALGGTVFIERNRRMDVGPVNEEIVAALADGALVVIFPEGTSTNGEQLLPFRSSLLEPATLGSPPVAICYLSYEIDDGDPRHEICYWGGHTFLPHAIKLMGKKTIRAKVRFGTFQRTATNRKDLALELHEAVQKLKSAG